SSLDSSFSIVINKGNFSTGINQSNYYPDEEVLYQNFPNPFNASTTIKYFLPVESRIRLAVYNLLGEEIKELINSNVKAGFHELNFDAGNLASGIYLYRLSAVSADVEKSSTKTKKLILLK
ncbi:MAG TPA: T9SS type A sorting domain-containing protein, partial [Ignavibacteriaceae bacterium]|nr:T9SS type A sorting domain-containing protein [Ignavibacteriaceae bacterium]